MSLSVAPNPVVEGRSTTVTATLSGPLAGATTIPLTVTDDTAESNDHGSVSSVSIVEGATAGSARITTAQDIDRDDEVFTVALDTANLPSSVRAGRPSSVAVTISEGGTPAEPRDDPPGNEPGGDDPGGDDPDGGGGGGEPDDDPTNRAPTTAEEIAPPTLRVGAEVRIDLAVAFDDPDGDTLACAASGAGLPRSP